jgi:putative transposase
MPNFRRREVDNEVYFTKLIFYIHNNPVHHRFTQSMGDWDFSSYNAFLSYKKTKLLKQELLNWFGEKKDF